MQAVIAGRSRSGPRARYMYTGSLSPTDKHSCLCRLCYFLSSVSAVSGTMFTVFGLTGFFSTKQMNIVLSCLGVLALFLALGCISIGLLIIVGTLLHQLIRLFRLIAREREEETLLDTKIAVTGGTVVSPTKNELLASASL